ncbi:MAG TPA: response regulator, partial [Polyangiaceae bacterium]|nr:response regulator [Polyangiaceae bacterium]
VAKFCQVDLKTIHNWADRGEIRHFRTPGRHLRFRRVDVLDFLRKYGYPVPEVLKQGRPRVHVVDEDPATLEGLERALSARFEVRTFAEPVDALIAIGSDTPDVVVLDIASNRMDGVAAIARLRSVDGTQHVRILVYSARNDRRQQAIDAGAAAFVHKPDVAKLTESIDSLVGG